MATGLARGAAARGCRIAFGDGKAIRWDQHCAPIFQGNSNIARPGSENAHNLEWIAHYKGRRAYNVQDGNRWRWNYDFRATPGEVFLTTAEIREGKRAGKGFVLIEPNLPKWKSVSPNKDWGMQRYQAVADALAAEGHAVVQFAYGKGPLLAGVRPIPTTSFRDSLAILRVARLYVGPEGGLHHGAAAMGVQGVILFGGFIPPAVTGYAAHTNLTGGAEACGSLIPCQHCRAAMDRISVEDVIMAAQQRLATETV